MTRRDLTVDYDQANFAQRVVHFLEFVALVLAPGFLGGLAFFFVGHAFTLGVANGLRSFAAVILPLMVLTFMMLPIGRGRSESRAPMLPTWAQISLMAVLGVLSMMLLELSTTIPIVELVLASGFAFILYMWRGGKDRAAPYCLGLVVGALGYVIIVGVPQI